VFIVNLSKDSDYHTQINNKQIPYASCNTTAAVMALKAAGMMFDYPEGVQPEDHFTHFMQQPAAWDLMRKVYPYAEQQGSIPQNFSPCMEWGINKIMGKTVDWFTRHATLRQMIWHLCNGRPMMMSGKFTPSGHFITLVGFKTLQSQVDLLRAEDLDMDLIEHVLVDDPYGDYHTSYRSHKGNNIEFDLDEYHQLTNLQSRDGSKWLHIISETDSRGGING